VPVVLALDKNPEDGKTLEHFFFVEVEIVPFTYGPVVARTGTTVAVLIMTMALSVSLTAAPAALFCAREEMTAPAAAVGQVAAAVSV
jgi:hypothetical protein